MQQVLPIMLLQKRVVTTPPLRLAVSQAAPLPRAHTGRPRLRLVCEPGAAYRRDAAPPTLPQGLSEPLTARPRQLLQLLARHDLTLSQAAEQLHISVSTANQHVAAAKRALGVRTLTAAVVTAVRLGLVEL